MAKLGFAVFRQSFPSETLFLALWVPLVATAGAACHCGGFAEAGGGLVNFASVSGACIDTLTVQ